jgi:hypothetical protein
MSVWNKVLLFLVGVGALVFFHAALRTLKTFKSWSDLAAKDEREIKEARKAIDVLRDGDPVHKIAGLQQLHFDLDRILINRGRIWANCSKKNVQFDKDGRLEVTLGSDEGGFSNKGLLYLFEEGDDQSPGKYLGEYTVGANGKNNDVILLGTAQPTPSEANNLRNSRMPWVAYEMMPADQHELFASLGEDLRKKFFPEPEPGKAKKWWLPDEFLMDGQVVNGKPFERQLRDYLTIIRACEMDRTLYDSRLHSLERDQEYLSVAAADSEKQQAFATKSRAQALQERDWQLKQQKATAAHYSMLQTLLGNNKTAVQDAISKNAETARQIAQSQKDAVEQIDRRTRSMVRFGAAAN